MGSLLFFRDFTIRIVGSVERDELLFFLHKNKDYDLVMVENFLATSLPIDGIP